MQLSMIGKFGPSEAAKKRTKEDVLKEYGELEIKADHYSRTDWEAYNRVLEQLKNLDAILLDIYNQENETFLQTKQGIA